MSDSKAQKRITGIKEAYKEERRNQISFTKTLKSIDDIELKLWTAFIADEEPSNGKIGAAKALLDSKWKKMNKLLPDLKAIEHSGAIDSEVTYKPMIKRFDGSVDADS